VKHTLYNRGPDAAAEDGTAVDTTAEDATAEDGTAELCKKSGRYATAESHDTHIKTLLWTLRRNDRAEHVSPLP
jgi:hypothetical protein